MRYGIARAVEAFEERYVAPLDCRAGHHGDAVDDVLEGHSCSCIVLGLDLEDRVYTVHVKYEHVAAWTSTP
jgi:hypothetical protein